MANQQNYPEVLQNVSNERPQRITNVDAEFIKVTDGQVIFGATDRDLVEIWIYNPDSSFAGHLNLSPDDTALGIATIVDNVGSTEVITVDLATVAQRTGLETGRYSFVVNFFRDEVGSEAGYKLYIVDISTDRTELRLFPVTPTLMSIKDIFEFVIPSVPRQFAKGLLDELFGQAVNAPTGTNIDATNVLQFLEADIPRTISKINFAGMSDTYSQMISTILNNTYITALNAIVADNKNLNIQHIEFDAYISNALQTVIADMKLRGQVDPRFKIE
jgi:hypothetical protein